MERVVQGELGFDGHVIIQEASRVLFETEDFEDNNEKTLEALGIREGMFINVLDDDEPRYPVAFSISPCVFNFISNPLSLPRFFSRC